MQGSAGALAVRPSVWARDHIAGVTTPTWEWML